MNKAHHKRNKVTKKRNKKQGDNVTRNEA